MISVVQQLLSALDSDSWSDFWRREGMTTRQRAMKKPVIDCIIDNRLHGKLPMGHKTALKPQAAVDLYTF
jgi:hypothetical protein